MDDYCEFSDLLRESCAHCKRGLTTLPAIEEQDDRDWRGPAPGRGQQNAPLSPGRWFAAQFPGYCSGCAGEIKPGDMIRANGTGGWACEDCG